MSDTHALVLAEIEAIAKEHLARGAGPGPGEPRLHYPPYRSSVLRSPSRDPVLADPEAIELAAPVFGDSDVDPLEADLTIQRASWPVGERITVSGRVVDGGGRPLAGQLIEVWQANAAGRYWHMHEVHDAPRDHNFVGAGRCLTGPDGSYKFTTIKPGPYPWRNHINAWRPAHIHFSVFGNAFTHRLVTQMYFPGDPLFPYDPIMQSVVDPEVRARMVSTYDPELSVPEFSAGYRWDIVLSGARATPTENA